MIRESTDSVLKVGIPRNELIRRIHERDASLDGRIVLGVRSTGIYCRPSCHSKRVRDSQIVLFNNCSEAEVAGFRACKKCSPSGKSPRETDLDLVKDVRKFIHMNLTGRLTLMNISEQLNKSPYRIQRVFTRETGISPREYIEECRLSRLKTNLERGESVTEAIYDAGFNSPSGVYRNSRRKLGMTPAEYRNGGDGMNIKYTTGMCQYGRVIVASTERGICFVSIQDSEKGLIEALKSEFPTAVFENSSDQNVYIKSVTEYLDGKEQVLDFDLHGTSFQRTVWAAIRKIPFGETRSYSDVADSIGKPAAVRAVAHACASNPVPLIIPCHRVIRKDGSLGGYGLGIERKKIMLDREKKEMKGQ